VAKMLNAAGYYTEPTPDNVAVSLLQAKVETTDTDPSLYLTQQLNGVYTDNDPRSYPLSSYSYMILPTTVQGQFSTSKGKTLAAFSYYAMCQGQQESASLGYSPMPYNLVNDTFDQIKKIPGQAVPSFDLASCKNPTIDPSNASDPNLLARIAPQPAACDKQGSTQCATGTAGDTAPTSLNGGGGGSGGGGSGGGGGSSGGGGSGSGGRTGSSSATSVSTAGGGARGTTAAGRTGTPAGRPGTGSVAGGAVGGGAAAGVRGGSQAAGANGLVSSATCDPSSGSCGSSGDPSGGSTSGGGGGAVESSAAAVTTTVPTSKGWSTTQSLMVFVGGLIVLLVVAPGVAARLMSERHQ
jgi:hypothetical protein